MPKNRFGGKNAKKMANKKIQGEEASSKVIVLPEEEGQYFAKVTKRQGDGRFLVDYVDDSRKIQEGMARVPGSSRRITRNIRDGSIILYQLWGLSENDNKGSVLHHYTDQEVTILSRNGFLKELLSSSEDGFEGEFVKEEEEEPDIDAI